MEGGWKENIPAPLTVADELTFVDSSLDAILQYWEQGVFGTTERPPTPVMPMFNFIHLFEEVKREFEATTEATTAPEYRAILSRFLALEPPAKTEANPDEVACLDRAPFAWTKSKQTAVLKERKQKEADEKDAGSDNAKVVVVVIAVAVVFNCYVLHIYTVTHIKNYNIFIIFSGQAGEVESGEGQGQP
jgi:hypothetical protein